MKTFYIIIIALAIMVFGIFYNGREIERFISQSVNDLVALDFSKGSEEEIIEVAEGISRGMERFAFCIRHQHSDAVNDHASTLITQAKLGAYAELEITRTLLIDLLTDIGNADRLSFREIF